jgi:hypothetical protein
VSPRFFSPDSFWNQPIPPGAALDPHNDGLIAEMDRRHGPLHVNSRTYAMPVYGADPDTPPVRVAQRGPRPGLTGSMLERERRYRQHPDFAASLVPIPEHARPDPADDAHLAVIDRARGLAWDMWRACRRPDGSWESSTGMVYPLDGPGVWKTADFPIRNGESIHFYGPSRAAGVPIIAGLIMEAELRAGRIEHKLAFAGATRLQHFCPPAVWTDGACDDGPMQGQVLQLDPGLDLDGFQLSPAARTIARALQDYGAVAVDGAHGNVIYAEGLEDHPGRTWDGLLDPWDLRPLGLEHFRWLAPADPVTRAGDNFWRNWRPPAS